MVWPVLGFRDLSPTILRKILAPGTIACCGVGKEPHMRRVGFAVVTIALVASCGGGGETAASAGSKFNDICRTMKSSLSDLDPAADLSEVASNAKDASSILEDGLTDLKKITLPSNASDASDLLDNFADQLDAFDAIAKAAKADNAADVQSATDDLTKLNEDSNTLADDADASKCGFSDSLILGLVQSSVTVETVPPTTATVPETVPVDTVAPDTVPLDTVPSDTVPFDTAPIGDGTRVSIDFAALLTSPNGYTFENVDPDSLTPMDTLLSLNPATATATGSISGLNIFGADGSYLGLLYLFLAENPLADDVLEQIRPQFDLDSLGVQTTIGEDVGYLTVAADSAEFYTANVDGVLWLLGSDEATVREAFQAFLDAL